MLDNHAMATVAAEASTIDERLRGALELVSNDYFTSLASRRLDLWCQSATGGDRTAFESLLRTRGLTLETAVRALVQVRWPAERPLPRWARRLSWALTEIGRVRSGTSGPDRHDPRLQQAPFWQLFEPLVRGCLRELAGDGDRLDRLFAPAAIQDLERSIAGELGEVMCPVLMEEWDLFRLLLLRGGEAFRGHVQIADQPTLGIYDAFIERMRRGELSQCIGNRPVLGRLLGLVIEQWLEATRALLARLAQDCQCLSETFNNGERLGKVCRVRAGLSDPHDGRQRVSILEFECGCRVVYKPRPVALIQAWSRFADDLTREGAPAFAYAPRTLSRDKYGWTAFAEFDSLGTREAAAEFFREAGGTLCVLYLLQGTDFHHENIVACGTRLALVDLETLFHPGQPLVSERTGSPATRLASARLYRTVLSTDFLPQWIPADGHSLRATGGLSPQLSVTVRTLAFSEVNSDRMAAQWQEHSGASAANLPVLDGKPADPHRFRSEIVEGFRAMYRFLLARQEWIRSDTGPLRHFYGHRTRVILRPTRVYAGLIRRACASQHLCSGVDWSVHFEFLARLELSEPDITESVMRYERKSLSELDIPTFWTSTDGRVVLDSTGRTVGENMTDGISQVRERASLLSLDDLLVQETLIDMTLEASAAGRDLSTPPTEATAVESMHSQKSFSVAALERVQAIADILQRSAVEVGDECTWIEVVPVADSDRPTVQVAGQDLYAGSIGIALFFAALYESTQDQRYYMMSLKAANSLRRELADPARRQRLALRVGLGAGTGIGSLIYAFVQLSDLLGDDALLEDARICAELVSQEAIDRDEHDDILTGKCGAMVGLMSFWQRQRCEESLSRATNCADALLRGRWSIDRSVTAARDVRDRPLTGLSHGAAGIALGLARLGLATGKSRYLDAANCWIEYERSTFDREACNWPDFRPVRAGQPAPVFRCQWCHGATGVGIARLGASAMHASSADDVRRSLRATLAAPDSPLDNVCCGNFGRVELLLLAAERGFGDELKQLAVDLASRRLMAAHSRGSFGWVLGKDPHNPAFFVGIAGIGYQLLRCLRGPALPSVLAWESAQRGH